MYSVSAWFSFSSWPRRALTTSPMEMIPASTSPSTTGRWRKRRSVIDAISCSTESSATHVTTSADITDCTVRPSALGAVGGECPHDVALGDDAVDVLAVVGDHQRADPPVAQLGDGVGQRRLLADRRDVGSPWP